MLFLSIQAQDFIEEHRRLAVSAWMIPFLSIQAQDFIEEREARPLCARQGIPEHSSSGLH